jgi:predicted nucleic acid-binding protein
VTIVIDASVVVAALIDTGAEGRWAVSVVGSEDLASPHLMPAEVANILRFTAMGGGLSVDDWRSAHHELTDLRVAFVPYSPFAQRVWELRDNVTPYDGWYVALAESLGASLATLDRRLSRAPGPRCRFITPDA